MLQSGSRRQLFATVSAGARNPEFGYQSGRSGPEAQKCSKVAPGDHFLLQFRKGIRNPDFGSFGPGRNPHDHYHDHATINGSQDLVKGLLFFIANCPD